MAKIVRNVLAVILGFIIGGAVNMAIVMTVPMLIPPPAGVDVTNPESIAASMHLFEAKHFIAPFVAHAAGAFVGALVAYLIAATRKSWFAYAIGVLSLCGGIAASFMIPAPIWFIVLDLVVAYIPMAWLAVLAGRALTAPKSAG